MIGPFFTHVFAAAILSVVLLCGCQRDSRSDNQPVPVADLSEAYPEVHEFIEQKRLAVETTPGSARAWGEYALALDAHEYTSEASHCYRVASEKDPSTSRWKYLLALRIKGQSPKEAEALLAEVTGKRKPELAVLIQHFDALSELGRTDEAMAILSKADQAFPSQPAVLMRQANHAFELRDFDSASAKLALVQGEYRETARLKARLASINHASLPPMSPVTLERLPSVDQMIDDPHLAAVFRNRRDPLWRGKQAAENARSGDQLGMMTLAALVRSHPELIENRLQLGLLMADRGNDTQAEQIVRQGLEFAPDNPRLLSGLASLAMQAERWTQAEERLNELLKVAPDHAAGWSDLGFVLEQLKQSEQAIRAYEKALTLLPGDSELLARRAKLEASIKKGQLP